MFTLSGVYSSLSFRCKCQILSGGCGLLGYITGTEGIVMKQDKILKILKGVYNRGDPPLSIPNREVKPLSADAFTFPPSSLPVSVWYSQYNQIKKAVTIHIMTAFKIRRQPTLPP